MIKCIETTIPGVRIIRSDLHIDDRGCFIKYLSSFVIEELDFTVKEVFFSVSEKNVIRGMHYQKKPFSQRKLVFCLNGACTDVCVDINTERPSFKKIFAHNLKPFGDALLIDSDIAHGFVARTDNTILGYIVDEYFDLASDSGIAWDSIDYEWDVDAPILSKRDKHHSPISKLQAN